MLTTGKAILDVANEHNFAVPAFNISDYAMFNGIVDVSEEKNAPLILGIYPDPDDALVFVRETGVDSLAVAIGTSHGIYPANLKPELKLGLLKEIKENVNIPLVLHGGSNNPDDEIAQATQLGINKINISSDIKVAYHQKMREVLADESLREPLTIQPPCIPAMKAVAAHKIE